MKLNLRYTCVYKMCIVYVYSIRGDRANAEPRERAIVEPTVLQQIDKYVSAVLHVYHLLAAAV